jgi:hypothetical protein
MTEPQEKHPYLPGLESSLLNSIWGFRETATCYNKSLIAEPGKALLDWICLNRQEGLPTPLDELRLQFLTPVKLRAGALRFPRTVSKTIKDSWLKQPFRRKIPTTDRQGQGN